ncbi:MAG: LTA synthase family protein [Rhodanobacter sp.]
MTKLLRCNFLRNIAGLQFPAAPRNHLAVGTVNVILQAGWQSFVKRTAKGPCCEKVENRYVRRIAIPALARMILVVAIAMLLSTWIDPYLGIGSSLAAQAVNAILPVILVLLLWGLLGRAWLALVLEVVLLGVLRYADHMKVMYLNTDLVYADFTVISGLMKDPQLVLGFLHPTAKKVAGVVAVLVVAALVGWFTRRQRRASWAVRMACVVIALAGMAIAWTQRAPDVIHPLRWEVFSQVIGAQRVGIAGNILLGRMTARDVKRSPDPKAEQAFWNEPLVRKAAQEVMKDGTNQHPDIVIIQSESLFEPSQLCGFADTPVLKNVARQQPRLAGNLHVPVFGGRTLQTEFEVLTGAPISFYPGSMFAYYELMDHRIDALPHMLDTFGYKTIAMHPNSRGFWRRDTAMPDMGFATFQDIGSFIYPRDFSERGHVTDAALTRAILAELDSANRPTFVTAISMDNHGPWGQFAPRDDTHLGLPDKLTGEGRAQMADYVAHAIDADNAYGFLLEALKRRSRPTIVLFYGDHLPALPPVYEQLCFKDGKKPQEHFPPYRVWANFTVPQPPDVTSAYLLQGWLMKAAGLPLKGHILANAVAGIAAHDPAASEADRERILGEYANIAAANIAATAPAPAGARTVFVGRDHALEMLMKHESGRHASGEISVRYNDLYLEPNDDKPSEITFDTKASVASLTLRPYIGAPTAECLNDTAASKADIIIEGDGRELYRASLTPQTTRLATLDLRGVSKLTMRADEGNTTDACDWVYVRVAQMLCYSAECNKPGPGLPTGTIMAKSRILSDDPIEGDIAELASMVPERRKHVDAKMANLEWMVGREKGKQQGYAPFKIGQDAQLFMHPADDHSTWIDFDVTGLDSLELSPHINQLSKECRAMNTPGSEAGVVGLALTLDGKPVVPRMVVDRNYDKKLPLTVKGGHNLRIEVDKGNDVAWCDWFSVGVTKLDGPAVAPSTSISQEP